MATVSISGLDLHQFADKLRTIPMGAAITKIMAETLLTSVKDDKATGGTDA